MSRASLEEALKEALRDLPGKSLRVGFSGGLDSTVLLHATARQLGKDDALARLTAHHIDHGLVVESGDMALHCRGFAKELGVRFACDRLKVPAKGNEEANARDARYACWRETLVAGETLLLAHHADDQAETLLMHLMRGAGGALLQGMPRTRDLASGRLLRPFLHLPRSVLRAYAETHGLTWYEDSSNQDLARNRNFIRHKVLPVLKTRWPQAVESIAQTSLRLDAEFSGFDALLAEHLNKVVLDETRLSINDLLALPPAAQGPALRRALKLLGVHSVSAAHIQEMLARISSRAQGPFEFAFGSGLKLTRFRDALVLRKDPKPGDVNLKPSHAWQLHEELRLPHGELVAEARASKGGACLDQTYGELEVRLSVGGERLRLRGMTKKVSRVFQESSVPPWQRASWPLLYSDGRLLAVAGIAVDDAFACDEGWLIEWRPKRELQR